MALYTSDWNSFGDGFYRKYELYTLRWAEDNLNLSHYDVIAAHYSGPIALMFNEDKFKASGYTGDVTNKKNIILIFSSSGILLGAVKHSLGSVVYLGWTHNEELICVFSEGIIHFYDIFGTQLDMFHIGSSIQNTKIIECRTIYPYTQTGTSTGLAILTDANRFYFMKDVKVNLIQQLPDVPEMNNQPLCWDVITDSSGLDLEASIIVSVTSTTSSISCVFKIDTLSKNIDYLNIPFECVYSSVNQMAVSLDGSKIAFFTDTGFLWLGDTEFNFKNKNCEFNTKSKINASQLLWCGNSAVAGLWKNTILLIGLDKSWLSTILILPAHIIPEIDGIRIINNFNHEFLYKISDSVVNIFKIGSIEPGALLLEASKEFEKHSHKADEYIKMLNGPYAIKKAVDECIEAAGNELKVSSQKMLLRAASFGKCFLNEYNPQKFVEMCQILRVLNSIRSDEIGLALTYNQYKHLTFNVLLDRLILRRFYCLGLRVSKYLKIKENEGSVKILSDWALYKMKTSGSDEEEIAREISDKLGDSPGISYAKIANMAIDLGRTCLAIKLLDRELKASEQVFLLLKLKQYKQAIQKAIESGDSDLIFSAIYKCRESMPASKFVLFLRQFGTANALYEKFYKEDDPEKYRQIVYYEDDSSAEGFFWVSQSTKLDKLEQRQSCLISAVGCFRTSKNDFAVLQTEEQIKLLKYQDKLEAKFNNQKFLDLSLQQTIQRLLTMKEHKLADELKKEYKVPDRRFWWTKLTILAEQSDWLEIEKMSKKKSPIGYEPFVDVCLNAKNRFEAQKYVQKVKEENKVKYLVKVGLLEDAVKFAFSSRDREALEYIKKKCGASNKTLVNTITSMEEQLSGTRK